MTPLPDRELQILDAAARGLTMPETSAELFLSVETIRSYRKRVLKRTGARNMTQAVAMWVAEGNSVRV